MQEQAPSPSLSLSICAESVRICPVHLPITDRELPMGQREGKERAKRDVEEEGDPTPGHAPSRCLPGVYSKRSWSYGEGTGTDRSKIGPMNAW